MEYKMTKRLCDLTEEEYAKWLRKQPLRTRTQIKEDRHIGDNWLRGFIQEYSIKYRDLRSENSGRKPYSVKVTEVIAAIRKEVSKRGYLPYGFQNKVAARMGVTRAFVNWVKTKRMCGEYIPKRQEFYDSIFSKSKPGKGIGYLRRLLGKDLSDSEIIDITKKFDYELKYGETPEEKQELEYRRYFSRLEQREKTQADAAADLGVHREKAYELGKIYSYKFKRMYGRRIDPKVLQGLALDINDALDKFGDKPPKGTWTEIATKYNESPVYVHKLKEKELEKRLQEGIL